MARIQPVKYENADEKARAVLDTLKKKMGKVINVLGTMAQSSAVVNAYLSMSGALKEGSLDPKMQELLALTVGEENNCDYCVAAHTALGQKAGLNEEQTVEARRGRANDEKQQAAITFARKLVKHRGKVTDEDVNLVRNAGFTDGEIGEIVAHVALNLFTNYFNHVADTDVDFPPVPALN